MPKETPYTTLEDDWWCCLKIFSSAYSLCILNDYTFTLQQDPTCGFMSDLCACKDHLSGYRNPRSPTHLGCSMNNPLTAIITILVYSSLPWCESAYHLPKLSLPGNKNFTPSWKAVNQWKFSHKTNWYNSVVHCKRQKTGLQYESTFHLSAHSSVSATVLAAKNCGSCMPVPSGTLCMLVLNCAIMHVFLNCDGNLACTNKNLCEFTISKLYTHETKQHWPWRAHSWPSAAHLAVCLSHSPAVEACLTPAHTASEVRSEPCAVLTSVPLASSNHQTICACVGVQ